MSKTKKKLAYLKSSKKIEHTWEHIKKDQTLSTREKLEKLVNSGLKNNAKNQPTPPNPPLKNTEVFFTKEYLYPIDLKFKDINLYDFYNISNLELEILSGENLNENFHLNKIVFFDTETTGLSGGTGTIPFMLGFGFFEEKHFKVKIFILSDLSEEELFLTVVNDFLAKKQFALTVTYNGKSFDLPLMETRAILLKKKFNLSNKSHLDLLYPARMIWKNTYDSRKLGFLGEILLGLSRDDDIPGSQIPQIFFDFLRSQNWDLMEKICEHNSMDLVGLCGILILISKYLKHPDKIKDKGEALGLGRLLEKKGFIKDAKKYYNFAIESDITCTIDRQALINLSILKKKQKKLRDAEQLWIKLLNYPQPFFAFQQLAIYYEHRAKNHKKALNILKKALSHPEMTQDHLDEFEKRIKRVLLKSKK